MNIHLTIIKLINAILCVSIQPPPHFSLHAQAIMIHLRDDNFSTLPRLSIMSHRDITFMINFMEKALFFRITHIRNER